MPTVGPLLQRKRLRLHGYDYTEPGAYFVTICVSDRSCLFGDIVEGSVRLSELGRIVHERWIALPQHHRFFELDAFVVMPNHVHGVLNLLADADRGRASTTVMSAAHRRHGAACDSLGSVVGSFKAAVTRAARRQGALGMRRLWQQGFYEHVVRNDFALNRIRQYIAANPGNWSSDPENPRRTAGATQASPLQAGGLSERGKRPRTSP
jgi:REP element-mobilizing transposase RayT